MSIFRRWRRKLRVLGYQFSSKRRSSGASFSRITPGALTGNSSKKRLLRARLLQFAAVGLVAAFILGLVVFFGLIAWVANDLPDPNKIREIQGQSTKITDRNGEVLYDVYQDERRNPVNYDQLPQYLKDAVVATEDKDFYKHKGFDPLTPFRMAYNVVFNRRVIGGSTLTQQLVKNSLLSSERTLTRKLKEFILAIEIERQFSKEEILLMYLNEAPYGGTAVGIGSAAQVYFNKNVQDLNLVESAILAGLPQRPSAYSPFFGRTDENGQPLWQMRSIGVLRRMREDGYIDADLEKQALEQLPNIQFADQTVAIKAPHFVFYVQDQLEEMFGSEMVEQGGLQVTTTLDLPFQNESQAIVAEEIAKVQDFNITNGAAMAMDPRNGEILAMVGSKNYFADDIPGKFNVAVDGLRQPGSSIKPVTYVTGFKQGMTPATMFVDSFTNFAPNDSSQPYQPRNYDGNFRGPMSLRRALAESNNVVAVKTLATVGVENMLRTAYEMGFKTLEPTRENLNRFGLAVTLGGAEVHLIDSVTAYSAFANGGTTVQPVSILEVKNTKGEVLYQHRHVPGKRVLKEEEAFLINSVLSDDQARSGAFGTGSQLNVENRPIAVKTGTTNDQKDNWTLGWSRSTIVGVWVGNNDNSSMTRVASGVTGASPIWRRITLAAIASGRTTDPWEIPEGVEQVAVDQISGYPEHDGFPSRQEWVIKGSLPTTPDPIHAKVQVCRDGSGLASAADIERGDYDEKTFITLRESDPVSQDGKNRWQEGIDAWINSQGNRDQYQAPTNYCDGAREVRVEIEDPDDKKDISGEDVKVRVRTFSDKRVEKVEIWVNDSRRETLTDRPYETTLRLSKGRYRIKAIAFVEGGAQHEAEVRIGTGGESWEAKEPSPVPSPKPSPVPSPTPTASPDSDDED
jgi:penicillin-binding protein 1C